MSRIAIAIQAATLAASLGALALSCVLFGWQRAARLDTCLTVYLPMQSAAVGPVLVPRTYCPDAAPTAPNPQPAPSTRAPARSDWRNNA